MNNKHAKSPCCGVKLIRFGGRRRQCPACAKTFRIRQKKRGRKVLRLPPSRLRQALLKQIPLHKIIYQKQEISNSARYKRFSGQLKRFVCARRKLTIRGRQLILVMDGLWFAFNHKDWVLYVLAIKPIASNTAYFLEPALLPGKECLSAWRRVLDTIPKTIKKRVIAYVCDGFTGNALIGQENGWIQQRCHFHLILHLQNIRGLRKKYWSPEHFREQIYQSVRGLISTKDQKKIKPLINKLSLLTQNPECPRRLRFVVGDVLRALKQYRSYRNYPKFNLPNTTNVIESMNGLLRESLNKLNNPEAVELWAKAYLKARYKLQCNGADYQPN